MPAKFILSVVMLLFVLAAFGQDDKSIEKVVIGDARFILHKVQKKETLYSISRLYDCTQEEVLANNKEITGVIKKGMTLRIPDHSYQKPPAIKVDESKFVRHQVVSGENFHQLKLKYGVEEEELLKVNPELKDGLKAGMNILVPRKEATTEQKDSAAPRKFQGTDHILNIGLYLPISAAVTDSLKPTARTLSFLAFYQGALIAVDHLTKNGIKTKLYVYDTEKMSSTIDGLVKKPEFLSLDLLIGPVYPELQKQISELSAKNRIPMVSPLSTEDKFLKSNPYYFQANPVRKVRMDATADYISREFAKEKIIFLETDNGSPESRMIRERIASKIGKQGAAKETQLPVYNIWTKGNEGLELQLMADKPNILVMAETNEVNVSIAMNRLALLSKKYPLVLVGIQEFQKMQSIDIENLHDVNLRFLTTSFVDYTQSSVLTFVENFKNEFGTEPSLFAFQGYDVISYFLTALQKAGNLTHGFPPEANKGLLHSSYHFSKVSDLGGYFNDSFTVVEYSGTFDLRSLGTIN